MATGTSLVEIPSLASVSSKMLKASVEPEQSSKRRSSIRRGFDRRSLATLLEDFAGLYASEIVPQHRFAEAQHLQDPLVCYGVKGVAALAPYLDVAAPGQAAQVVRDPRLRRSELAYQISHLRLALPCEEQQDREPRRIGEPAEEPSQKTHILALPTYLYPGERTGFYDLSLHQPLLSRRFHTAFPYLIL